MPDNFTTKSDNFTINSTILNNPSSITLTSKSLQQATRRDYIDTLVEQSTFTLGMTLTINRVVKKDKAETLMRHAHNMTNRKVIGKRKWYEDKQDIINWIAFPEFGVDGTNLHYHLVVFLRKEQVSAFQAAISKAWNKLVPSGEVDFTIEQTDWVGYITKKWTSLDDWIITGENNG